MAYTIKTSPDAASAAAAISDDSNTVERIRQSLLSAYEANRGRMGYSRDLQVLDGKMVGMLSDVSAMASAIIFHVPTSFHAPP